MKLRSYILLVVVINFTLFSNCKKKDDPAPTPAPAPSQPVGWSATSGATSTTIYRFCVSGNAVFAANGGYILKSNDEGATWNYSSVGINAQFVYDVKSIGTTLFASSIGSGVYTSTNSGSNWSTSNSGLSDLNVVCLTTQGSTLLAGTQNGVFTSTNNASTWISLSNGIPANTSITGVAYDGSLMLAIGTPTISSYSLFKSIDHGANWNVINTGIPISATIYCVDIIGGNCYIGTTSGNFISTDSGNSWSAINSLSNPVIGYGVKGNNVYALCPNAPYVSTDNGLNFVIINSTGLNANILRSMITTTNYIIVSNSSDNIYRRQIN